MEKLYCNQTKQKKKKKKKNANKKAYDSKLNHFFSKKVTQTKEFTIRNPTFEN